MSSQCFLSASTWFLFSSSCIHLLFESVSARLSLLPGLQTKSSSTGCAAAFLVGPAVLDCFEAAAENEFCGGAGSESPTFF